MLIINGNNEMLASGLGFDHEVEKEAAESLDYGDFSDLAFKLGIENFEVETSFQAWNGGYCYRGKSAGKFVHYDSDNEKDKAFALADAIEALLQKRAASIQKSFDESDRA